MEVGEEGRWVIKRGGATGWLWSVRRRGWSTGEGQRLFFPVVELQVNITGLGEAKGSGTEITGKCSGGNGTVVLVGQVGEKRVSRFEGAGAIVTFPDGVRV